MQLLRRQVQDTPDAEDTIIQALKFVKGYSGKDCPEDDANFKCKWEDENGNEVLWNDMIIHIYIGKVYTYFHIKLYYILYEDSKEIHNKTQK